MDPWTTPAARREKAMKGKAVSVGGESSMPLWHGETQ
jgi:hypothetical protein